MKQISVILTLWKRTHIQEQLEALSAQTLQPAEVWIYHCCNHVRLTNEFFKHYPYVQYQHNSSDLGYFGRFSLGMYAKSPYLCILDDDVIPSAGWLERCIQLSHQHNAIISPSGRLIPKNDYAPERLNGEGKLQRYFVGDAAATTSNECPQDTFVDFGCSSWFMQTDWLDYFWWLKPRALSMGEDMHLSAACMLKAGIRTMVPQQGGQVSGNVKRAYGHDNLASWKQSDFIKKRTAALHYLIDECGWRPMLW